MASWKPTNTPAPPKAPVPDQFIPTKFKPPFPTDTPNTLFISTTKRNPETSAIHYRFVGRANTRELLIYTAGASINSIEGVSGERLVKAGCAFTFRPHALEQEQPVNYGTIRFRLENHGPTGEPEAQTSQRADLRAVIAALQFRSWSDEGYDSLVIAADSVYLITGITGRCKSWERNGWLTATKKPMKNRDLWKLLLKEVRKHQEKGLIVSFWKISRHANKEANLAAQEIATEIPTEHYLKHEGIMLNQKDMGTAPEPFKTI